MANIFVGMTKLLFVVLLAASLCIDVDCDGEINGSWHREPRDFIGGLMNDFSYKATNITGGIVGTILDTIDNIERKVMNLGGSVGDLIEKSHKEIPGLAEGRLSVFDDDGNRVPLLLEVPKILNLLKPVEESVTFILHTNRNPTGEILRLGDVMRLRSSSYDPRQDTVFVAHGWRNSHKSKACSQPRDAYLEKQGFNVIVVDWAPIANDLYVLAANTVSDVGKHVAKMMDFLDDQGVLTRRTRLVGHSLGAHVVGLAGLNARVKPQYVTGLDPALPLFLLAPTESRISPESGENVEIIHSNAGILGYMTALGHADFYPNGGQQQRGCLVGDVACSHSRSHEIYSISLNNPKFFARKCPKPLLGVVMPITSIICKGRQGLMGTLRDVLSKEDRGTYYLDTTSEYPFY